MESLLCCRAKVYPDVYPLEDDAQQLSDSEDDWGIDDY